MVYGFRSEPILLIAVLLYFSIHSQSVVSLCLLFFYRLLLVVQHVCIRSIRQHTFQSTLSKMDSEA